ncbi:MAG: transketolase [Chlamydiales bacterium]
MSELKDTEHDAESFRKDELAINTIRALAMDAVQAANSGHPGTPMGLAPVAYTLWQRFLRFDPNDPIWPNRDRFVLSGGHASMLLYSLLHLTQVKAVNEKYETLGKVSVSLEDIKHFRQLDSKCPGHPEYRWTSGIETTTGPLGQGAGNSVGMAIASQWMAAYFNRPDFEMFNYNVYITCGDGDMMEGVTSEAASLAGHLQLSNLCWIYDNNHITIEGSTDLTFSEDVATRFLAYGWNVLRVSDANDLKMLHRALDIFEKTHDRPTLIIVDSHIGYGSPNKQDTAAAHGEPLGEEEVRLTKRNLGWPEDKKFYVPDEVYKNFQAVFAKRGKKLRDEWIALYTRYKQKYPELAEQLFQMQHRKLPQGWDKGLTPFPVDPNGMASRTSSGKVLNAIAPNLPWLIGGAADLSPSTKTHLEGMESFNAEHFGGRNFHFGIREHAMGSILNGLALSKVRAFGAGFFIFSDYCRPTIRLAALMEIPVIYIFTHDSIGVGEDGPTHQPVEHLASIRAIPGVTTIRPCDANEVVESWRFTIEQQHEPSVLVLSRQNLPTLDRTKYASAKGVHKGAYILADAKEEKPDVILIGTGSEVHLCIKAYEKLTKEGIRCRVVSMPSWEIFEKQSDEYRNQVLPPEIKARVSIEQASTFGWERYVGLEGHSIGMNSFGASAPLASLLQKFGFTEEHLIEQAKRLLQVIHK